MEDTSKAKRVSVAFDAQKRRSHLPLLVFCGLETAGAGSISLLKVQEIFLQRFPEVLARFPAYSQYITLSTFVAFFGGLVFLIYPVTLSVWIGYYLAGMSLAYMVLAAKGIADFSLVAFNVAYWLSIALPILVRLGDIPFYIKGTKVDFPIYLLLSVLLGVWGYYEWQHI